METQILERKKRSQRDYSLSFKLQVVGEIERGELNYAQADRKYGIKGHCTISKWVKKHSTFDWKELPTMIHKKTPKQRIKELETLLAAEKEKVQVLNIAIDLADDLLKTDIRKKYLPKQSKKQKPQ